MLDDTISKTLHHLDVAQVLLDGGADVNGLNAQGKRPLYWRADFTDPEVLRWLIDRGADVDATDGDGETALHRAAEWGLVDNVKMLLQCGAKPKAKTTNGKTPTMLAREAPSQYPEIKKLLKRKWPR